MKEIRLIIENGAIVSAEFEDGTEDIKIVIDDFDCPVDEKELPIPGVFEDEDGNLFQRLEITSETNLGV